MATLRSTPYVLALVCLVHGIAIAALLRSKPTLIRRPEAALIRASLIPGPAMAMEAAPAQSPKPLPKLQAPQKPKVVTPKSKAIVAAPASPASEPSAQTVASPPAESSASNAQVTESGGTAEGESGPITQASARYKLNAGPVYPSQSLRLGEHGTVMLHVLVGVDGKVHEAEVSKTSGFHRLDKAALEMVHTWVFVPARRGEEAVATWVNVPVAFELKE